MRRGSDRRGGRGVTLTLVDLRSHFPRLRVDVGKSLDNDTAQVTSGGNTTNTFVVHYIGAGPKRHKLKKNEFLFLFCCPLSLSLPSSSEVRRA